jgi:hypothetical protein
LSVLEQPHPPSIAQQNVIQQTVNAAKRSWTVHPVLRVVQQRAGCVQPLVCNTVVPRERLEMDGEIHFIELTRYARLISDRLNRESGLPGGVAETQIVADE